MSVEALVAAKQLKDLKKEIKFWETAFQDQNGRKPEKGDISKEPDVAKKYKLYAKLKSSKQETDANLGEKAAPADEPAKAQPAFDFGWGGEQQNDDTPVYTTSANRSFGKASPATYVSVSESRPPKVPLVEDTEEVVEDFLTRRKRWEEGIEKRPTAMASDVRVVDLGVSPYPEGITAANAELFEEFVIETQDQIEEARMRRLMTEESKQRSRSPSKSPVPPQNAPSSTSPATSKPEARHVASKQAFHSVELKEEDDESESQHGNAETTEVEAFVLPEKSESDKEFKPEPVKPSPVRVISTKDDSEEDEIEEFEPPIVATKAGASEPTDAKQTEKDEDSDDGRVDATKPQDDNSNAQQALNAVPLPTGPAVPGLINLKTSDLSWFSRVPEGAIVRCKVYRKKSLLDKSHPSFFMYNEADDKFLLAGRKRKKFKDVNYLISTSMEDLSKDSDHYIAKIKANSQRTSFTILDARAYDKNTEGKGLVEIACINYAKNCLPRELSVAIHNPALDLVSDKDKLSKDIMSDLKIKDFDKLTILKNKSPRWNEVTQSHCLNFGGRVTQPSIKNFQLVFPDQDTPVRFQFGRCGSDYFTLDYQWPLSPVEAFGIALSSFDAYDGINDTSIPSREQTEFERHVSVTRQQQLETAVAERLHDSNPVPNVLKKELIDDDSDGDGLDDETGPNNDADEEETNAKDAIVPSPAQVYASSPVSKFLTTADLSWFRRLPKGSILRCKLYRKKNLLDKKHPSYFLYNEQDDKFLLAARKRKKSKDVNFLISTSLEDLSKESQHYIAKIKANPQRTQFLVLDARTYNKQSEGKGLSDLACISYAKYCLPREFSVAIQNPAFALDKDKEKLSKDIIADIDSGNSERLFFMKNKSPRWNEETKSHCLNFGGRVTEPSVKNFQLISDLNEAVIILQFGRCGADYFTLDMQWPLTPVEGFAIALSSFDAYDNANFSDLAAMNREASEVAKKNKKQAVQKQEQPKLEELDDSASNLPVPPKRRSLAESKEVPQPDKMDKNDVERSDAERLASSTTNKEDPEDEDDANVEGQVAMAPVTAATNVPTKITTYILTPDVSIFGRLPKKMLLRCLIYRKTNILDKNHPSFFLYNETDDKFLLAARKRKKSKDVNYLISTSQEELSKDSEHYIAKIKANSGRTIFSIMDARGYDKQSESKGLKELACVNYAKYSLPREFSVAIHNPKFDLEADKDKLSEDILEDLRASDPNNKLCLLKNKAPRWSEVTQSHCLNFGGRVTKASVKNFQLIAEGNENNILLQFGRCGTEVFACDIQWPLTPLEGFAIALTSFEAYDNV